MFCILTPWLSVCSDVTTITSGKQLKSYTADNAVIALALAKKKEHVSVVRELAQDIDGGITFLHSQADDIFERYDVDQDELPALVLLRNFDTAGKDQGSQRDVVIYKHGAANWVVAKMRKFILREGVKPIQTFGGNSGTTVASTVAEDIAMSLTMKSPMIKLVLFLNTEHEEPSLLDLFSVGPESYFGRLVCLRVVQSALSETMQALVETLVGTRDTTAPMAFIIDDGGQVVETRAGSITIPTIKKMTDNAAKLKAALVDVTFEPGLIGFRGFKNQVMEVIKGGQAMAKGVQKGWTIAKVDGVPFADQDLSGVASREKPYTLTFNTQGIQKDEL